MEELEKILTEGPDEKIHDTSESDNKSTIRQLQQKLTSTESELAEVTELKNAEIDVLQKQLNRAEHIRTNGQVEQKTVESVRTKTINEKTIRLIKLTIYYLYKF